MTGKLFPDHGDHQNLPGGEQSGNIPPPNQQNPRSRRKNTVPQKPGNSRGTVPRVFPDSPPPREGNGDPIPALTDLLEHQIELTETDDAYTITFPTRSSYLRAGLRPRILIAIGQLLPNKPVRLAHAHTKEAKPSNKPLKIEEPA